MRLNAKSVSLILLFLLSIEYVHSDVRSELDRFTLISDRASVDKHLQGERYNNYIDFNLALSSQVKKFVGDIKRCCSK